jgi:hypothetical protein
MTSFNCEESRLFDGKISAADPKLCPVKRLARRLLKSYFLPLAAAFDAFNGFLVPSEFFIASSILA